MKYYRYLLLLISFISFFIAASPVLAQESFRKTVCGSEDTAACTFTKAVEGFYNWSIGVGFALAVIMLMFAGYTMVTAAGDPQRIGFAKQTIVGAIAGLILLAGARIILNFLNT